MSGLNGISKLISKDIYEFSCIYALTLYFDEDQNIEYHVSQFDKNKKGIELVECSVSRSLPSFKEKTPVFLNLQSKKIIQKTIQSPSTPHINPSIYTNTSPFLEEFIQTASRKDILGLVPKELDILKDQIVSISLGIQNINYILSQSTYPYLELGYYTIDISSKKLEKQNWKLNTITLQEVSTSSISLVHLSDILAFFENKNEVKEQISPDITGNYDTLVSRKKLEVNMLLFPLLILIVLVINYAFQNNYHKSYELLNTELQTIQESMQVQETEQDEINEKFEILTKAGFTGNAFNNSFLLDQIGITTPSTITLTDLYTFERKKKKEKINFSNSIQITGDVSKGEDLQHWINSLLTLKFIRTVDITKYEPNKNNQYKFTLLIELI